MATAGWILVFSQFKQVMVLPMSFFDYGSLGIGGYAGPMDGLQGIVRSTHRMSGDMCSCHRLTCGTGSRASSTILSYVTSSGMRGKRSRADDSHPKLPCIQPRPKCFDRVSRALVLWILLLKVRHDTLNTINCPDGQGLVVCLAHKLHHCLVSVRHRESGSAHLTFPVNPDGLAAPLDYRAQACEGATTAQAINHRSR